MDFCSVFFLNLYPSNNGLLEKITENFESVMLDSYLGLSYGVSNILHGSLLNQVGFLVLKENIQNFASKLSYDPQNLLVSI